MTPKQIEQMKLNGWNLVYEDTDTIYVTNGRKRFGPFECENDAWSDLWEGVFSEDE